MGVLKVIRVDGAGGGISSLLMFASPSIVVISLCPEKDGSIPVSSEES